MSIYQVQGQDYELFGAGITAVATSITLTSCTIPTTNIPVTMAMFGDIGYATLEPETSREENISFTGIVQNINGTATLTGVTRGINLFQVGDVFPADINNQRSHIGGSILRFTNSAPYYELFGNKFREQTISGLWKFPGSTALGRPQAQNVIPALLADEFITKGEVISLVTSPVITPSVVSSSSATTGTSTSISLAWNHTHSGVNGLLLVQVSTQEDEIITGIDYNGDAMTQVISETRVSGNLRTEIWSLVNPDLGTNAITITMSGVAFISATALSFNEVNQTTPIGVIDSANGSSTSPSVSSLLTTQVSSVLVDALGTSNDPMSFTAGADQSLQQQVASGSTRQIAASIKSAPSIATYSMDYTIAPSTDWAMCGVEVIGIVGGFATSLQVQENGVPVETGVNNINILSNSPIVTNPSTGQVNIDLTNIGGGTGGSLLYDAWDDFLSGDATSTYVSALRWTGYSDSPATPWVDQIQSAVGHYGVVRLGSANTGNKCIYLGGNPATKDYPIPNSMRDGNIYTAIISPSFIANNFFAAFRITSVLAAPGTASNSINFDFDEATGDMFFRTRDGATTESTNLGAYTPADWYEIKFEISGSSVLCYLGINGATPTLVATHSTNVPVVNTISTVEFFAGNTGTFLDIDFFGMKYGRELSSGGGNVQVGIQFQDEGSNLGSAGTVNEVDFVGAGVTASRTGDKVTVSVTGGGAGGNSYVIDPLVIPSNPTAVGVLPASVPTAKIFQWNQTLGHFIQIIDIGPTAYARISTDGITWTLYAIGTAAANIGSNSLTYTSDGYTLFARYFSGSSHVAIIFRSTDGGVTWSTIYNSILPSAGVGGVPVGSEMQATNGMYVIVGRNNSLKLRIWTSPDAITWTLLPGLPGYDVSYTWLLWSETYNKFYYGWNRVNSAPYDSYLYSADSSFGSNTLIDTAVNAQMDGLIEVNSVIIWGRPSTLTAADRPRFSTDGIVFNQLDLARVAGSSTLSFKDFYSGIIWNGTVYIGVKDNVIYTSTDLVFWKPAMKLNGENNIVGWTDPNLQFVNCKLAYSPSLNCFIILPSSSYQYYLKQG